MNYQVSLYEMFAASVKLYADRDALLFKGKSLTYREVLKKIDKLANGLNQIGLKEGDTITFALPNVYEAVYGFYASAKLGLKSHMVHPKTPAIQLKKQMEETNSHTLVILDTFLDHYKAMLNDDGITIYLVNPMDEFSWIKRLIYRFINRKKLKTGLNMSRVHSFRSLYSSKDYLAKSIDSSQTAALLHSGGTSGKPKTIELSHASINYLASQVQYIVEKDDLKETYMLSVLPMFHGFGLCMGIHAMLTHGGVDTLMPKFNPKETVRLIAKNRINIIIGVPSLFESLLKQPGFNSPKMRHIEQAFVGGDYVATDLKNRFNSQMKKNQSKARLLEGYGLTEVVTVCCVNTLRQEQPDSVGKALPGIEMKIKDLASDRILPANQDGEIIVSGPTQMNGYLNDPLATEQTLMNYDGKVWVKTGDLGYMDDEGFVYYKQRLKRIIKVSGVPVLPAEIENLVMHLPEVDEVAAVSAPDINKGNIVRLFIVWKNQTMKLEPSEIKTMIKNELGVYAIPKEIIELDVLPKTIIGKTDILRLEKYEQ